MKILTHRNLIRTLTLALTAASTLTVSAQAQSTVGTTATASSKPSTPVAQKSGMTKAITLGTTRKTPMNDTPRTSPTAAGASVAIQKKSWKDNLSINYLADLHGPAVGNISRFQTSTQTGAIDRTSPVSSDHIFAVGYRFENGFGVRASEVIQYSPINNTGFTVTDPFIAAGGQFLKRGNLTLIGELREYLPVSQQSQERNTLIRSRAVLIGQYAPSNSRWSFAATSYAQHWLNRGVTQASHPRMKFMLEPAVNYQIKPNLSAGVYYDMFAQGQYRNSFFNLSPSTSLSPNMSWDVNSRFNVTPYLNIPTGERVATDTTTMNLQLSVRML